MRTRDLYSETTASGDVTVTATCADCGRDWPVTLTATEVADAERLMAGAGALMRRAGLARRSGLSVQGEAPTWALGLGRVAYALALERLPERCGCPEEAAAGERGPADAAGRGWQRVNITSGGRSCGGWFRPDPPVWSSPGTTDATPEREG